MHRRDPGFADADPRAELWRTLALLAESGEASREDINDCAVWAAELFGVDYVARVSEQPVQASLESLLIAAHDGFACECCGYHTHEQPVTRESHQLCMVCGWEDCNPGTTPRDHSNLIGLDTAQLSFAEIGAVTSDWLELVSPPTARQARRRPYQTIEEQRIELLESIELVFDGVRLNGGVTLDEARAADNFERPDPEVVAYQRRQQWTSVSDEQLEQAMEWTFLDERGAFHYLIAAMRYTLTHFAEPGSMNGAIQTILQYREPANGAWLFALASRPQLEYIARCLEFLGEPWLGCSDRWMLFRTPCIGRTAAAIRTRLAEWSNRAESG